MPFFSVVIPLYNKEQYIKNTIESVLNQTFEDFEVIVVNDGSTDNSLIKLSRITDDRIKIVNQENKGLSSARNKGISITQGKIITLLDADDIWFPKFLETIHTLSKEYKKASFYSTDYLLKYENFEVEPIKNINPDLKGKHFLIDDFYKASCSEPIFTQSNIAFKREKFNQYEIYNEKLTFGEDIEFYLNYLKNEKIAYCYKSLAKINCFVEGQITLKRITNLCPPNLNKPKYLNQKSKTYLKYIDIQRYIIAQKYMLNNDYKAAKTYLRHINFANLTLKQRIILKSPYVVVLLLRKLKSFLLKKGIKVSSFR